MRRPFVALCLSARVVLADAGPLTVDAAVAEAAARSAELRAAEAAVDQARAGAAAAGAWRGAGLTVSPLTSDRRDVDVEAELEIVLVDPTLRPAARAAGVELTAALRRLDRLRAEQAADVRGACWELVFAERLVAAADEDVALARRLRDAAARARELGERPGVDVLRAELELSRVEQAAAEAAAGRLAAREALLSLLGREPGASLVLADDLVLPTAIPGRDELLPRLTERADVRLAELDVELARRGLDLTRAERGATVAAAGFREDEEHGLRVTLRLPFDAGRRSAGERSGQAAVRQAEERAEAVRRLARLEFDQAHLAAMAAAARHGRVSGGILAQAARLAELAQVGYQVGESSILEVIDARRLLAEARTEAVVAEAALAAAWIALERAIGATLPPPAAARHAEQSVLGPPSPRTTLAADPATGER